MKKVIFTIIGKSAEQTAYLMRKVLKKYKYINVIVEDKNCFIVSDQVSGTLNTWLVNHLLESKRFMGRFHRDHPLFDIERMEELTDRYYSVLCRFGFWDSEDYPNELAFFNFRVNRTKLKLQGLPLYKACYLAEKRSGYVPQLGDAAKPMTRSHFIRELMDRYNNDEAIATKKVDRYFSNYNIKVEPAQSTPECKRKMAERFNNMVSTLKFLGSAKSRANWIKRNANIVDEIMLYSFIEKQGRDWFIDNIGEIEGIT